MIPEVLTYIMAFKSFLKKNDEIRSYFLGNDVNEDEFFEMFGQIAEKNYEDNGAPQLSKEQLEILRKSLLVLNMTKNNVEQKLFIDVPNFGQFCLN
jgi:hypothetical protein